MRVHCVARERSRSLADEEVVGGSEPGERAGAVGADVRGGVHEAVGVNAQSEPSKGATNGHAIVRRREAELSKCRLFRGIQRS
jgi:hypothetical protein